MSPLRLHGRTVSGPLEAEQGLGGSQEPAFSTLKSRNSIGNQSLAPIATNPGARNLDGLRLSCVHITHLLAFEELLAVEAGANLILHGLHRQGRPVGAGCQAPTLCHQARGLVGTRQRRPRIGEVPVAGAGHTSHGSGPRNSSPVAQHQAMVPHLIHAQRGTARLRAAGGQLEPHLHLAPGACRHGLPT